MKKILILGSSDSFLELVEAAHRLGCYVICADNSDTSTAKEQADMSIKIDIENVDEYVRFIKEHNVDGIITSFSDRLLVKYACIAEKAGLKPYISSNDAIAVTRKSQLRKRFEQFGIPQVKFVVLNSIEEKDKVCGLDYPVVIKPNACFAGRSMYIANNQNELNEMLPKAFSGFSEGTVTVEEYYDGQEIDATCWINNGEPYIIHTIDRIMWFGFKGRPGQTYVNRLPSIYTYQYESDIIHIAKKVAEAFSIKNGPLTLQMIVGKKGIRVIESLIRFSGGREQDIGKYLTGFDSMSELIRVAMGMEPDSTNLNKLSEKNKKCAFYFPIVYRPGTIASIEGFDTLKEKFPFVLDVHLYSNVGDVLLGTEDMNQVCGRIYCSSETYFEMDKNIKLVKDSISIKDTDGKEMIINNSEVRR